MKIELTPSLTQKLLESFPRYAQAFWKVSPKIGRPIPFRLNNPQRICWREMAKQRKAGRPVRQKWLKYRQGGISTFACAVMQHGAMTDVGCVSLSVADKQDLPRQWIRRALNWLEQTPESVRPVVSAASQLELYFAALGSRYYIGSAEGKTPGMGYTIRRFHASEVAMWLHPIDVLDDLMPAIPHDPDTWVIFESTGEMVGDYWHNAWWASRRGEDDYTALFLPWFVHEDYKEPADALGGLTAREKDLVAVAGQWAKDFPEHAAMIGFDGLTDEQLMWRRMSLNGVPFLGDEDAWACKYPSTPEEAFLAGGRQLFTPDQVVEAMRTLREPVWRGNIVPGKNPLHFSLDENASGFMLVWEDPDPRYHYAIGADCQWGEREKSDFDVAYVECLETGKVCARARGHFPLPTWGRVLAAMGYHYNTAPLAPERNARAATALMPLLLGNVGDWRYPNVWVRTDDVAMKGHRPQDYGWLTTDQSKGEIVQYAQSATLRGDFDWCDELAVQEMQSFVVRDDGTWGSPEGANDDCVMARMITGYVAHKLRGTTELHSEPQRIVYRMPTLRERVAAMIFADEDEGEDEW